MKARLLFSSTFSADAGPELHNTAATEGTIIDRPDAWELVEAMMAVPADEECALKTGKPLNMTPEEEESIKRKRRHVEAGIQPEDYQAFDDGLMTGYDGNGDWIPGPNYVSPDDDDDDSDSFDEETDDESEYGEPVATEGTDSDG